MGEQGPVQLVCATANPDKVAEIAAVLPPTIELLPRPADLGDVVEDAPTLEGNARLKAAAVVELVGHGALADDTGLFVDAIDGAPGVISARYAGENASYNDNVVKLLAELDGVEAARRSARFITVMVVLWPDGSEVAVQGVVEGTISAEPRGTNGFGYDPVFVPTEGDGRTFAEMADHEKHAISHRSRAIAAVVAALVESDSPANP